MQSQEKQHALDKEEWAWQSRNTIGQSVEVIFSAV